MAAFRAKPVTLRSAWANLKQGRTADDNVRDWAVFSSNAQVREATHTKVLFRQS